MSHLSWNISLSKLKHASKTDNVLLWCVLIMKFFVYPLSKIVHKVKFHPENKGFTCFVYIIIFSVYLHQKRYKIATNNTYFTKISVAIVQYGCVLFCLP